MNGGVASRGPAGTITQVIGVILISNIDPAGAGDTRNLCVTAETKVGITRQEELRINRPMLGVTTRATFAHGRVFKGHRLGLFPVTLGARLVDPRHCQTTRRFENLRTMRIVALNAVHLSFEDRMMLGKMELRLDIQMALQTGLRVFARIDDEVSAGGAQRSVFAARTVTGFTAILPGHAGTFQMQTAVRTRGKLSRNIPVTISADLVAHESRAFNVRGCHHRTAGGRTGVDERTHEDCPQTQGPSRQGATILFRGFRDHLKAIVSAIGD